MTKKGNPTLEESHLISAEEEKYILSRAYIPEHSVGLMTAISGGEPHLIADYFCCHKGDWIIVVGYPLQHEFDLKRFESLLEKIKKRFKPKILSLMVPKLPGSLAPSCVERESDLYYTLDIQKKRVPKRLEAVIDRAAETLRVERSREMLEAHAGLSREFIERVKPSPRVRELLFRMPEYVAGSKNALILNAWDRQENLAAFYIVDLAPENFSSYVIGCHSKKTYVPGASDLVFYEMIKVSRDYGKPYIHLGLGVNRGIRQFKKKWGGEATLPYEMCQLHLKGPSILDAFRAMNRFPS